jgi:hypothetical protein
MKEDIPEAALDVALLAIGTGEGLGVGFEGKGSAPCPPFSSRDRKRVQSR